MVSSLISLCKVFYFCWHSQSTGLDVFMTWFDVNVSFPCPTVAFLLLIPQRVTLLWSTTRICLFPTFWFYDKKSSHGATDGRIRAESRLSSLWQRAQKQAQDTTGTWSRIIYILSAFPQLLVEHVCHSGHCEGGELPLPSALEQLIKLKFISFNSANPKLALESIFRSGRLTQPQVTPDVQTQVWRQESRISSQSFAKATLLITEPGGETKGSFLQPRLTPLACASVSPFLKQRQPGLTMSAIEEISTLHSPLLTLERHFLYQEWAPQGIYAWLAIQACFLPVPAAHTAQRCWED